MKKGSGMGERTQVVEWKLSNGREEDAFLEIFCKCGPHVKN